PVSGGAGLRAQQRPCAGSLHYAARGTVLHWKFSRRHDHRKARPHLQAPLRPLPGDAALPGFTEPSRFPDDDPEAGGDVPPEDGVQVFDEVRRRLEAWHPVGMFESSLAFQRRAERPVWEFVPLGTIETADRVRDGFSRAYGTWASRTLPTLR